MPRAATTSDVFNAVAEPRRRTIIEILGREGDLTVTELVDALGLPQPAVSKHLGVLREVGVVTVTAQGRHRSYRLNAEALKPVHAWVSHFEKFWANNLSRVKARAERAANAKQPKEKL